MNDEDSKLLPKEEESKEEETKEEEPKEVEVLATKTNDDEQPVDEPEQQPITPSSPVTLSSSPPENRPTFEFKATRSNSIAERAKLFEQKGTEPTSPVSKRGPRTPIVLPTKEVEEQTLSTNIEQKEKPTQPAIIQEQPETQAKPLEEPAEPTTPEIPPTPTEPPPPVPVETEPLLPGPVPPQSPPPPDDEPPPPPTREESLMQSPISDQARLDAIKKSATVPPPSGRKRVMSEK